MKSENILDNLAKELHNSTNRHITHEKLKNHFEDLCSDKDFIHDAIKKCIKNTSVLSQADNLFFYLLISGDVIIAINLFPPIADGAKNITHDNIHHHGWRLLTTGIISGNGYETINFVKKSHEDINDGVVNLKFEQMYKHTQGGTKFVDSYQPHVVFHPETSTATLAMWSAEKPLVNQKIKKYLKNFTSLRNTLSKLAHATGISKSLGLNPVKGIYFHPENGRIVETINYSKPTDGPPEEIIPCMFKFFQQIGFNDSTFFNEIKKTAEPDTKKLCDMLIENEEIKDAGIKGNIRRRFTKDQILDSIKN